jgi:peptidoglycan/LPS O-acetylase OafA/YrhL
LFSPHQDGSARDGKLFHFPQRVTAAPRSPARLPSLDGWRALSITLVIGAHCRYSDGFPSAWDRLFEWLFDGDLGVRCFFVISGFLITWLLLREHQLSGEISLRDFYMRRVLRIVPVYFAFVFVLWLLTQFTHFRQHATTWVGNLTFTTDFLEGEFTSAHLWSLAVEEQFYVIWPISLVMILRNRRPVRLALMCLGAPLAIAPVFRVLSYVSTHGNRAVPAWLFPPHSFFNYVDSIALGCTGAILFATSSSWLKHIEQRRSLWSTLALFFVLGPYALQKLQLAGKLNVPFGPGLQAVGLTILIMQSIASPRAWAFRGLNVAPVCWLGVLSYSLYIWQQIFCSGAAAFGVAHKVFLTFPLWVLAALLVATVSYYGFERPFLGLRRKFRHVRHGDESLVS